MIGKLAGTMLSYLWRAVRFPFRPYLRSYLEDSMRRVLWEEWPWLMLRTAHDLVYQAHIHASRETSEFIRETMADLDTVNSKFELLDLGLEQAKPSPDSLILEFGVYKAETINYIAKELGPKYTVYGFDSFQGLPERWRPGYPKSRFTLKTPPSVQKNVKLIVGWFDEVLPKFLKEHPQPVSFLHVDCDLYSSTKTIFEHLAPRIQPGTVIVFDEYFNYPGWKESEHKAFLEFVEKYRVQFDYLSYNQFHEQLAVQIRSIEAARAAA
jgi:hypothetical protein